MAPCDDQITYKDLDSNDVGKKCTSGTGLDAAIWDKLLSTESGKNVYVDSKGAAFVKAAANTETIETKAYTLAAART